MITAKEKAVDNARTGEKGKNSKKKKKDKYSKTNLV